jgi:probable F420-dependent oxidoreductase
VKLNLGLLGQCLYPGNQKHWFEDITPEEVVRIVQAADELGFDHFRIGEHIVMHESWVDVMGPRWVDCTSTMAFVAGASKRIKVASAIIVLPYHNPIELAKSLSTIDYFSGGRVIFTAAPGYMEWEYELLGVPFAERGKIMDEYLDAMVELWTADKPVFEGRYVSFKDIVFDPKPTQKPHLPIWFGGHTKASARRVARLGDGWMPWGVPRAQLPELLAYVQEQPEFQARPRPIDLFATLFEGTIDPDTHDVLEPPKVLLSKDAVLEQIGELAELGVTVTDADPLLGWGVYGSEGGEEVPPIRSTEEYLERLQWIGEEILPEAARIEPKALVA